MFDQTYLINLERRSDKLIKVVSQLNRYNIDFTLIKASDGYSPKYYYKQSEISPGAYGYILTWERIISDAILNNYSKICILDDDVVPIRDFNLLLDQWIKKIPDQWKILLLGATQHTSRPDIIPGMDAYYPRIVDGSFAVVLDSSIFQAVLERLQTGKEIVDSIILRSIYRKYPTSCYVAYPNLMIADVTSSDIRAARSQEILSKKLGWNLKMYHWPQTLPVVSVIISAFNAEKTIIRSMDSILNQTYRPIELIITDDGSTDITFDLICDTLKTWEYNPKSKGIHIKLNRHNTNRGSYVARNLGLSQVSGDYVTFQDADDISLDYRIEEQLSQLLLHKVKFTCCLILRTHLEILPTDPQELHQAIRETRIHDNKYCCREKVGLVTTLFTKEFLDSLGKYKEIKWGADSEFLRRIFPGLDPNYQIMNFLNQVSLIKKLYYKVPKIMYLSHEMTPQNLTSQRIYHKSIPSYTPKTPKN